MAAAAAARRRGVSYHYYFLNNIYKYTPLVHFHWLLGLCLCGCAAEWR
jgi:hypothetical protein